MARHYVILGLTVVVASYVNNPVQIAGAAVYGDAAKAANLPAWEAAEASPNASSRIQIPGYNISAKYPGDSIDGWTLSISVAAEVALTHASRHNFTGTTIRWSPPKSLIKRRDSGKSIGDDSWGMCALVIVSGKLHSGKGDVNSTCSGVVSDSCLGWLTSYAKRSGPCNDIFDVDEWCRDSVGADSHNWLEIPISEWATYICRFCGLNFVLLGDNPSRLNWTGSILRYGIDYNTPGDYTSYETAIQQIWVVVTGFRNASTPSNATENGGNMNELPGAVQCILASDFRNGTDTSNKAPTVTPFSFMLVLLALVLELYIMVL